MANYLKFHNNGQTYTATATSTSYSIPQITGVDNKAPRYLRLICEPGRAAYVAFGTSASITATTNSLMITDGETIIDVLGYTHLAVIRHGSSDVAINVVPVA